MFRQPEVRLRIPRTVSQGQVNLARTSFVCLESTFYYYSQHIQILEVLSSLNLFQSKSCMQLCSFQCVLHTRSSYPPSFDHPNNILRTAQLTGFLLCDFLQYSVTYRS
jgi:hypothetical protein